MHVRIDWDLCEGNGVCAVEAPEVFDMDEDDNLIVLQEQFGEELLPKVEAAARSCPKRAIFVESDGEGA
jgi:ferredoxin